MLPEHNGRRFSPADFPEKFTWPFRYSPHPAVRLAAGQVIARIDSDDNLGNDFAEGKMLGVLVVRTDRNPAEDGLLHCLDRQNGIFYLAAFSGNAGGCSRISGFVPPIFDTLDPEGHFKKEEAAISAISGEIDRLAGTDRDRILELKAERVRMSGELQTWLFRNYAVRNACGETKSVLDIFADRGLVPPGGTGDCAAPKLLNYAYANSLIPLAMGEFWYCGEDIAAGPEDPVPVVIQKICPEVRPHASPSHVTKGQSLCHISFLMLRRDCPFVTYPRTMVPVLPAMPSAARSRSVISDERPSPDCANASAAWTLGSIEPAANWPSAT